MNNHKILLIIATLCQLNQFSEAKNENLIDISARIKNVIKQKCTENSNDTQYELVLEAFDELVENWNSVIDRNSTEEVQLRENCQKNAKIVLDMLSSLGETLKPCLKDHETYIEKFMIDSYKSYSENTCKQLRALTGQEYLDTLKCMVMFVDHPETNPQRVCFQKSQVFGDEATVKEIIKEELCNDLSKIKDCYNATINVQCPNAIFLRLQTLQNMVSALKPC